MLVMLESKGVPRGRRLWCGGIRGPPAVGRGKARKRTGRRRCGKCIFVCLS